MRYFIAAMLSFIVTVNAFADWGHIQGPFFGQVGRMESLPSGGLLVATSGGLFASTDGGDTWFFTGLGSMDDPNAGNLVSFDAFEDEDGSVYVAMEELYAGTTALNDFQRVALPNPAYGVESILKSDGTWILASALEIWRSVDDMQSFTESYAISPIFNDIVSVFEDPSNSTLLANLSSPGGTYFLISVDNGQTWTEQQITGVFGELFDPQFGADGLLYFGNNYQNQGHLRYTSDYGVTNTEFYAPDGNYELHSLTLGGNGRIACGRHLGLIISTDGGSAFSAVINDVYSPSAIYYHNGELVAGNADGIHVSSDDGGTWYQQNDGFMVQDMVTANIDADGNAWIADSGRLYKQNGDSWMLVDLPGDGTPYITEIGVTNSGRVLLFGRDNDGTVRILYTDNGGDSWSAATGIDESDYNDFSRLIEPGDGNLYVGHAAFGPLVSDDNGASWSTINADGAGQLAISGDGTMYVSHWSGLIKSVDGGATWSTINDISSPGTVAASPAGGAALVASWLDLMLYDPGNDSWNDIGSNLNTALNNAWYSEITSYGFDEEGDIFVTVMIDDFGSSRNFTRVLVSEDNGATFTDETGDGYINFAVAEHIRHSGQGMMLALTNMGLFGEDLQAGFVEDKATAAPREFSLAQNYPNPFNPSTTIRFSVPVSGQVTLAVYDVLGREVARLVDGIVPAGSRQVVFDGSQLSSGVYFYQLRANGQSAVNRMILMK
ncbi:T9SS type A sorting domain-containing protein [bacterium]|nr:T9SS type A sorting domain-containing protein [bacterium]